MDAISRQARERQKEIGSRDRPNDRDRDYGNRDSDRHQDHDRYDRDRRDRYSHYDRHYTRYHWRNSPRYSIHFSNYRHLHSSSCGHYYYDGFWHLHPRSHYRIYRPGSLFFFIDLGDYRTRNFPEYVYRERYVGRAERDVFSSDDHVSQAYAAFSRGKFYKSVVEFKRALQRTPDDGMLYLARAQAYFAIGDYKSTYYDLIEGMTIIPEWIDVEISVAELYSNPDMLDEQMAALEEWVEKYPDDYRARFVLGYYYYFLDEPQWAKNELMHVLAHDENHVQAKALLDRILAVEVETDSPSVTREPAEATIEAPVTQE